MINLALDSSETSQTGIITSYSPKDFMQSKISPKRQIDRLVKKIRAKNQEKLTSEEQPPQIKKPDSESDYTNIIIIRRAEANAPQDYKSDTTQQTITTPQL